MSRSTFRVLFYLKRNAPKKNGLVPVMCRITVNGKISQFSCKLDVEEKLWDVNLGRMSGRSVVAQETNQMLDKIRVGINKAYQEIMDRDGYVSATDIAELTTGDTSGMDVQSSSMEPQEQASPTLPVHWVNERADKEQRPFTSP